MIMSPGSCERMEPTQTSDENPMLSGLIVDSVNVSRMIHTAVVHGCGFAAQAVETGTQAVELYVSGSRFDLVVLDISFSSEHPVETARKIRQIDPTVKMIGTTADSFHAESQGFLDAGGSAVFEKPLDLATLSKVLEELGM
ncbi:hypothetical protein Droror1_Dr00018904 [Drosera rotundifolia]